MDQECQSTNALHEGIITGIPIVIGYVPVAMAFGLLAKATNISMMDSFLFSSLVFAGASQFMALDLIKTGIALPEIVLATFLLNLRHMMMSASLAVRIKERKFGRLIFVAFGITDETFSIASLRDGELSIPFLLGLHGISYAAWVCGTILGYIVGSVLPAAVQNSMGIGLYAMFAAILVPEVKKSLNVLFLSCLSGIIYILIDYFKLVPADWSLVTAIIAASVIGVLVIKDDIGEVRA
jgi:4-azaleucine resistance transporter AzlC